mmetsp:Transcript_12004/g.36592  ORF Transcript_12004/g.36592 Transcript_12004/m.36592 type:complete len:460 (-) Transcript_12004:1821-3200(-)
MALIPPTLLAGVLFLFVLTKLRGYVRPVERLFYGIPYVVAPTQNAIRKSLDDSSATSTSRASGSNARTRKHGSSKPAKAPTMPIELKKIDARYFTSFERKFMFELDQCFAVASAFLFVYSLELVLTVLWSGDFRATSHHLAIGTMIVCILSLLIVLQHLGASSVEAKLVMGVFVISLIVGLLALTPSAERHLLDVSMEGAVVDAQQRMNSTLAARGVEVPDKLISDLGRGVRIAIAVVGAVCACCALLPGIRFSRWFFMFYMQSDDQIIGKSTVNMFRREGKAAVWRLIERVAVYLDAVFPLFVCTLYLSSVSGALFGEDKADLVEYGRLALIILSSILRLVLLRPRIRDYLCTALVLIQASLSSPGEVDPAALEQRVFSIHYFAPALALQYTIPPLISLVTALVAVKALLVQDRLLFGCFKTFSIWTTGSWAVIYLIGIAAEMLTDTLARVQAGGRRH